MSPNAEGPAALSETEKRERQAALVAHADALVGVTLAEIADELGLAVPIGATKSKGWSGQIIERELGTCEQTEAESAAGPDFSALGIELKTVPVDGRWVPLESTAVCVIDPMTIIHETWETSYVRHKLASVLWVGLEVPDKMGAKYGATSVGDRRVASVRLWHPSASEEGILRGDFELIVNGYFRTGRFDELTAHVGQALQVRPKARNNQETRAALDASGRPIRVGKSGFYLRPAFVASLLSAAG